MLCVCRTRSTKKLMPSYRFLSGKICVLSLFITIRIFTIFTCRLYSFIRRTTFDRLVFLRKISAFIWEVGKILSEYFCASIASGYSDPLIRWALRDRWGCLGADHICSFAFRAGMLMQTVYRRPLSGSPITGLNYFFVLNALRLGPWRYKRAGQMHALALTMPSYYCARQSPVVDGI